MEVAVEVAWGQRDHLPMAGDWREGCGLRAIGLPGDAREPVAQVCRSGGHVRGAGLRGGCAGLSWAGRLALLSWPGWERGAAPPALGAGRAERGPDVSAGGFVCPERGPGWGQWPRPRCCQASSFHCDPGAGGMETGEARGGGCRKRGTGFSILGA